MGLKLIKTKKDYLLALKRFEEVFQGKTGTTESDEADMLSLLIKTYEDEYFVIHAPGPIEAIRYRMQQQGLSNSDLAQILGFKSRVSDIFNKKRKLNITMIRKLNTSLHIPLEALMKDY